MSDDVTQNVRGYYAIAKVVGVSEKTARKMAEWGAPRFGERLPVYDDHTGTPVMRMGDFEIWKSGQTLPAGLRKRLQAAAHAQLAGKSPSSRQPPCWSHSHSPRC